MRALTQLGSRPMVLDRLFMRYCLGVNWCCKPMAVEGSSTQSHAAWWGKSKCQSSFISALKKWPAHFRITRLRHFPLRLTAGVVPEVVLAVGLAVLVPMETLKPSKYLKIDGQNLYF